MQLDYLAWLYKYGIYAAMIIGAMILTALVRYFAKAQYRKMDDSDKLESPSYEEMDSGIKLSDPEEEDPSRSFASPRNIPLQGRHPLLTHNYRLQ